MNKTNNLISVLKTDAEKYWLSPAEVDARLAEIAHALGYSGLGVEVAVKDVIHKWGTSCSDLLVSEVIDSTSMIKMSLFSKGGETQSANREVQQTSHLLYDAMSRVWAHQYRNEHGGLTLKAGGATDIFLASIPNLVNVKINDLISLVYVDLDKFKQINSPHSEGDRALRYAYACMHETARELQGLIFFDGGDEFILATPSDQPLKIASSLWNLRKKMQEITFGTNHLQIDMTAGVVVRPIDELYSNYVGLKDACEALTGGQEKKRGTITIEQKNSQELMHAKFVNPKHFFQLGISLSRSRQFVHDVFGDVRLNFIANQVMVSCNSDTPNFLKLENVVKEFTDWLGMEVGGECSEHCLLISGFGSGSVPKHAVALAVLHGISRAAIQNKWETEATKLHPLAVGWDDSTQLVSVTYNSQLVWGDQLANKSHLFFGPLVKIGSQDKSEGAIIGVQIGFDKAPLTPGGNPLPLNFLIDYIRVDDRPRTGGGLPDFWQVALAQVVAAQDKDMPSKVLVWGVSPENTETYKRLMGVKKWSIDDVALLAGLPTEMVSQLARRLPSYVNIAQNPEDLLQEIFDAYQSLPEQKTEPCKDNLRYQSILKRAMAEAEPLGQSEGIVCQTAAFAYPVVIDTLRKSDQVRHTLDDANQILKELIAFKIKLTTPLVSTVPAYLSSQKVDLESYAHKVLLNKDGLFRAKLENAGHGQIDGFVDLLSSYTNATNNASTRRACLVLPNELTESGELKTLGLISVWATPRNMENGGKLIDFVFVWRTVEAFIGLPYSLYGSIELAKQLVALISERVASTEKPGKSTQVGELTYIALSLHLGSDEYHMRVAKQIVDSASD